MLVIINACLKVTNVLLHGMYLYDLSITHALQARYTVYPKKYAQGFCFLCFVVVIHWLIFPYPSGLLHWHCGNLTIAPVPVKQPWWIWINTSCEFIMNDCITTTKQSATKPCAYFLGYTVYHNKLLIGEISLISWLIYHWFLRLHKQSNDIQRKNAQCHWYKMCSARGSHLYHFDSSLLSK